MSASQTARGDGETHEINFCLVRIFPASQPLMTDCKMGFVCVFCFPAGLEEGRGYSESYL